LQHDDFLSTLIVRQPSVPACLGPGLGCMVGIPTGTFDSDGRFVGEAAKALKTQIDIQINRNDANLVDMTELAYEDRYNGIYPSCDMFAESSRIFLYHVDVTVEELDRLNEGCSIDSDDILRLEIIPLHALWRTSPDARALSASSLYAKLADAKQIPAKEVEKRSETNAEEDIAVVSEANVQVETDAFGKLEELHEAMKAVIKLLKEKLDVTDKECRSLLQLFGLDDGSPTTGDGLKKQRDKAKELLTKLSDFFLKEVPKAWIALEEWKAKEQRRMCRPERERRGAPGQMSAITVSNVSMRKGCDIRPLDGHDFGGVTDTPCPVDPAPIMETASFYSTEG